MISANLPQMRSLFFTFLLTALTANAADLKFPIYYFSEASLESANQSSPEYTSDRYLFGSNTDWLAPALENFPKAVFTLGKLLHRSDDNCTLAPSRVLGVEVWNACRRHDYCIADLADYTGKRSFNDAFFSCNEGLKSDIDELCHQQGKHSGCALLKEIYFLAVSIFPIELRSFISEQQKQALFLADILRTQNPQMNQFINVDEVKRRLNSFCELNALYLKEKHSNRKWTTYAPSPHDEVPSVSYQECEEFQGGLIPKAL